MLSSDTQKAILNESILLMTQCVSVSDTESKMAAIEKAQEFTKALSTAKTLHLPHYITTHSTTDDVLNRVTTMQIVSGV